MVVRGRLGLGLGLGLGLSLGLDLGLGLGLSLGLGHHGHHDGPRRATGSDTTDTTTDHDGPRAQNNPYLFEGSPSPHCKTI